MSKDHAQSVEYEKMQRLADAFVEDILLLTDAEVMSEALEDAVADRLASWLRPGLDRHYVARTVLIAIGRALKPDRPDLPPASRRTARNPGQAR